MKGLFIKNLALSQGLNLIIKPLWLLVIDRTAQNLLGIQYGEYYIILNLTLLLNIVLDIGIQSFNNTHVAANLSFFKTYFKQLVGIKILLSIVYFAIVLLLGYFKKLDFTVLIILAISQVLTSFVLYFRSNLNGLHLYKIDSLMSVSDKFFGILICLFFYYSNKISIFYFASAQLIGISISLVIVVYLNLKHFKLITTELAENNGIIPLLKKSLPFAILFALMGLYTRIDVFLLALLLENPFYQTAVYAQGYRLLDASSMFAMLFAGLLLPMFAKQISVNEDVKPLTILSSSILMPVTISVAMGSFFFSEKIMRALTNYTSIEQIEYVSSVFEIIMICFIPMGLIFIFSTLLTAKKDIKSLNKFALIALVLNVVLNLFLIKSHQAYGAAITALVTQSAFALLCFLRCFKLFDFKFQFSVFLRYTIFAISLIGIYVLVKSPQSLILNLLSFFAGAIGLVFLLKIIDYKNVLSYFGQKEQ